MGIKICLIFLLKSYLIGDNQIYKFNNYKNNFNDQIIATIFNLRKGLKRHPFYDIIAVCNFLKFSS